MVYRADMPFSNPRGKRKGSWTKKGKNKNSNNTERVRDEPRNTETAPHILAALEAQRARTSQQQLEALKETTETPPQPPSDAASTLPQSSKPPPASPPGNLPGFVFDPTRDRFFRLVRNPIGTAGRNLATKKERRVAARAAKSAAVVSAAASAAAAAAAAVSEEGRRRSRKGRGLHSYVKNLRRGSWGVGVGGGVVGGLPAAPERLRRAAVESVVSSSCFRIGEIGSWDHGAPGTSYSAIDYDARRGVMAAGTTNGDFGMSWAQTEGFHGYEGLVGGHRRRRGRSEERACWCPLACLWSGQVSDVKFRSHEGDWACATASLGSAGEPGGVAVRYWGRAGDAAARTTEDDSDGAHVCGAKLRHGSMWCVEWDPLTPGRLATGPSSCSPVSIFDLEHQRLTPVAQLACDVFSISFLPLAAPGGGRAMVGGLRDGSVVLLDPRQSPRQNASSIISRGGGNVNVGRGRGRGCGRGRGRGRVGYSRSTTTTTTSTSRTLASVHCSIDHTHILQDGTRCLVKDRSGGLQTLDLRFSGRPLKTLVPPTAGTRAPAPGKFALDLGETVVATPIAAAPEAAGAGMVGGGERFLSAPRAWDAFSGAQSAAVDHRGGVGGGSSGGGGGGDAKTGKGDRLRFLSVSNGEVLNDIATPWTGMSLAPGISGRGVEAVGCHGDVHFWGVASKPRQGRPVVFEASLRSREGEGFGREQ